MTTEATTSDALRHRLLEGVLLRLARQPDAGDFVLRGGLLMRHWFTPFPRPVEDLDLVALVPLAPAETAARILPPLADDLADGVTFVPGRAFVEPIRLDTGSGVRFFLTGLVAGDEIECNVDVTFGPSPCPAPVFGDLPTTSGQVARIWQCRPESVVGHKMQAMHHRGPLGWRPKDLHDLRLLLTRVPLDAADLGAAIAAYMADARATGADARAVFGPGSWWHRKAASARWLDFARITPGAPHDLAAVVAEVAGLLSPVLEGIP